MEKAKQGNLGKLIVQAVILVSLVTFFFTSNAMAGGGTAPQDTFAKNTFIRALGTPPGAS
ncbi:MAG: hypothetical protein AB7W16_21120 [Candidatus Obscuribacterales bacterium]